MNRVSRKRAANVGALAAPRRRRDRVPDRPASGAWASVIAMSGFLALWAALALTVGVSLWVAAAYAVLSLVCLLAYAIDKSAAVAGRWRISEQHLLLLGLAGGWPGGLLAQQLLRHKSSKASFQAAFRATVVLNVVAFVLGHLYFRYAGPWR